MKKTTYLFMAIGLLSLIVLSGCVNQSKVRCQRSGGTWFEGGSGLGLQEGSSCRCPEGIGLDTNSECTVKCERGLNGEGWICPRD